MDQSSGMRIACRNFIDKSSLLVWLEGSQESVNSLMSFVNMGFNVRETSSQGRLCALYALEISLRGISKADVTFEQLEALYRSPQFAGAAIAYLNDLELLGSEVGPTIFAELTAQDTLSVNALPLVLYLYGADQGEVYQLGVCKRNRDPNTAHLQAYDVYLHGCPFNLAPSGTVWIINDNVDPHGGDRTENHFSGIARGEMQGELVETAAAQNNKRSREEDVEDEDEEKASQARKKPKLQSGERDYRKTLQGMPPRYTLLPINQLTDATLEELCVYYGDHMISWPGLALLLRQSGIEGGYTAIANFINQSRSSAEANKPTAIHNSIRKTMQAAIQELLGKDYKIDRKLHEKAFGAYLAEHGMTMHEFMNQHLFDVPKRFAARNSMKTAMPLKEVGQMVVTHPEHGHLRDRILGSMNGQIFASAPALVPGQLHPLVEKLPDLVPEDTDDQATTTQDTPPPLDRRSYPNISEEDVVRYVPDSLYGEPLLFAYRKYELSEMCKLLGIEGENQKKCLQNLRQRKRQALVRRAERLGKTYEEAFKEYEIERKEAGYHGEREQRKSKKGD